MSSFSNQPPLSYTVPSFPALYWPIRASPGESQYLYSVKDITRFTLYWTLITVVGAHFLVATWAVLMQFVSARHRAHYLSATPAGRKLWARDKKLLGENPIRETLSWVWLVPGVYLVMGALEALMAGTLVGLVLGALYNAGYFKMSTWTPLMWGVVNMLVLVVSSFRIQGGL